jgi:hypothetical protein
MLRICLLRMSTSSGERSGMMAQPKTSSNTNVAFVPLHRLQPFCIMNEFTEDRYAVHLPTRIFVAEAPSPMAAMRDRRFLIWRSTEPESVSGRPGGALHALHAKSDSGSCKLRADHQMPPAVRQSACQHEARHPFRVHPSTMRQRCNPSGSAPSATGARSLFSRSS